MQNTEQPLFIDMAIPTQPNIQVIKIYATISAAAIIFILSKPKWPLEMRSCDMKLEPVTTSPKPNTIRSMHSTLKHISTPASYSFLFSLAFPTPPTRPFNFYIIFNKIIIRSN